MMKSEYRSFDDLPITLNVEQIMPVLGIGRNTAYELVRSGRLRSIHIGKKIRIPKDAVAELLCCPDYAFSGNGKGAQS